MADVSIAVVREFFEENQFLVKINRKYIPTSKSRTEIEEIDLFVLNLKSKEGTPPGFVITPRDVAKIPRAIVKVKGWHTESFSPAVLTTFPKIFQFVMPDVVKLATQFFGSKEFWRILVVPSLPVTRSTRERSVEILKSRGVTGVIEFRTILELIAKEVRPNRNYFESDILQLIRLLKIYDMLKGGQLELFDRRRRKRQEHE